MRGARSRGVRAGIARGVVLSSIGAALALEMGVARTAGAQRGRDSGSACPVGARTAAAESAPDQRTWPAPLDRVIDAPADANSVGDALQRVETIAGVHFTYSSTLLPLGKRACVAPGRRPLGDVLTELLSGTTLAPVVAGPDQVVLAPGRLASSADAPPTLARSTGRLARVVITGTASGAPERASPYALAVVDRRLLGGAGPEPLSDALDGAIPGLWLWTQPPASAIAAYGSLRGASSFGAAAPKVYIDGIEVANPLLVTELDANQIERIEVIRGPQGAALYGADAISGVINIITRHDGADGGAPKLRIEGAAGPVSSRFASGSALSRRYAAELRTGTSARSASAAITMTSLGAYLPGASAQTVIASASARAVGAHTVLTGTLRAAGSNATSPMSPLFDGVAAVLQREPEGAAAHLATRDAIDRPMPAESLPDEPDDSTGVQRTRQYTVGGSFTMQPTARWTHVVVAGLDGYSLHGVSAQGLLVPTMTDSALRAARGRADRLTLRASSTAEYDVAPAARLTITGGMEHSTARVQTNNAGDWLVPMRMQSAGSTVGDSGSVAVYDRDRTPGAATTAWWSNTGILGQARVALHDTWYLSAGGRMEYMTNPRDVSQFAVLPMLGGAWVRDVGIATAKLRVAYGRGIRPAPSLTRSAVWSGAGPEGLGSLATLSPEEQSGVESGADVVADLPRATRVSAHVTRFDQLVSGLVQPVAMLTDTSESGHAGWIGTRGSRIGYLLENVGAISNRGWELESTASSGALSLAATLSLVQSRVRQLASGYRGDLRVGDRMLDVPARTMGVHAAWTTPGWSFGISAARAHDWIGYDRVALADSLAAALTATTPSDEDPTGPRLRSFWRRYDGVTHLGAHASVLLRRNWALTITGENLLNRQLGEPDNATVLTGRTVTLGIRFGP